MKKNIIVLISVLIFVAILFLFDLPAYNKVALFRSEIKNYQNFLKEKEELLVKVNQLKQSYESRKDEIDKIYYVLPFEKDISNLIVQFEALASENGLVLESINFKESAATTTATGEKIVKGYKTLDVSLKAGGNYQSFVAFLGALEFNIRLMDIKSIDFSAAQAGEDSSLFIFDISLEVYYQ
jgi:Tfp pilus assembly protein PilO